MHAAEPTNVTYGVMAEFDSAQALVDAARRVDGARASRRSRRYSPVPVEELNDIIHKKRTILPKLSLAGGSPAW